MNNPSDPNQMPKKHQSRLRKNLMPISVAMLGFALTIGIFFVFDTFAPHHGGDFSTLFFMLAVLPAYFLCNLFGIRLNIFLDNGVDGSGDQWSITTVSIVVIINTALFYVMGWVVKKLNQKS